MFDAIRVLATVVVVTSSVACGGGPTNEGVEGNVTSVNGITARAPQDVPKTVSALMTLLQSDAKGRLAMNASLGAWEYEPSDVALAPIKDAATVYFTTKAAGTSLSAFVLESEKNCGSSACQSSGFFAYTDRSVSGELGIAIDGDSYVFLGKFPVTYGPSGAKATDGYMFGKRDASGKETVAFTLKRYYVRQ